MARAHCLGPPKWELGSCLGWASAVIGAGSSICKAANERALASGVKVHPVSCFALLLHI